MKTNRKKMLLSSIAMLLVALVALGSATYAWFSQNKKVTASNISVTSSAAKGLVITKNRGDNWGPTAQFDSWATNTVFTPVSLGYTDNTGTPAYTDYNNKAYYVTGNALTGKSTTANFGADAVWHETDVPRLTNSNMVGSEAKVKTDYMAAYEIGVKSTDTAIDNVTMKVKMTGSAASYARVAIINEGGTYTPSTSASTTKTPTVVYGNENSAAAIVDDTPTQESQKVQSFTSGTAETLFNANLTAPANDTNATSKGQYFTILVWFEGEDGECIDANQSKDLAVEVEFTYA